MPKIAHLEDIAEIGLGFKSLQNDFFYINKETIKTFAIETRFLHEIYTLRDIDGHRYVQDSTPPQFVFSCNEDQHDLKGTGALRYIRSMGGKIANDRKQSGKQQTISEVLGNQGGRLWYAPKASKNSAKVWLRKAVGGVFAPFIFDTGRVVDQRCNYLLPKAGISNEELAAILTSSIFAYAAEINGSISMGAGALELPTTKLRSYPVPDFRSWTALKRKRLVALAEKVWKMETPIDWANNQLPGIHLTALDKFILSTMGTSVTVDRLHADLAGSVKTRYKLASDKTGKQKKKQSDSITSVASAIADQMRGLVEAKPFPDGFIDAAATVESMDFSGSRIGTIVANPMMGQTDLMITSDQNKELFAEPLSAEVAAVLIRAILLGRRHFNLPLEEKYAIDTLNRSKKWLSQLQVKLSSLVDISAAGSGYEDAVNKEVLKLLGFHPLALDMQLPNQLHFL